MPKEAAGGKVAKVGSGGKAVKSEGGRPHRRFTKRHDPMERPTVKFCVRG